jgi:stearoyl-CoA desaturase (Delta-9 desaturase)
MKGTDVTTKSRELDWTNILFLSLTPIIGVFGTIAWTLHNGFQPWMLVLLVVSYLLVGLSITAGYHRLFSHRSYDAHPIVQGFFAFFGALAAQNSILWWSSSHRVHHSHVDKEWDPYNIRRGFWWAHIVWIFYKNPEKDETFENAKDLVANPVVMWQHKYNKLILIAGGFVVPALIGGLFFGDAIAGLLWGGFLRATLIHHSTFFVNSLAHKMGTPAYNFDVSARDNWMVALLTFGEGYHSFHHRFAADFRNGIQWYQWDPSKWLIRGLSKVGLASNLRTTPTPLIEKARMAASLRELEARLSAAPPDLATEVRRRIATATENLEKAFELWKQHSIERAEGIGRQWRETRRASTALVREARREWRAALRMMSSIPAAATA